MPPLQLPEFSSFLVTSLAAIGVVAMIAIVLTMMGDTKSKRAFAKWAWL